VDIKRCLSSQDYDRWLGLLQMLNDYSLTDNKADCVQWALEKRKMFTAKSLYRFLTNRESAAGWLRLFGNVEFL
jgi:hypothetical protein